MEAGAHRGAGLRSQFKIAKLHPQLGDEAVTDKNRPQTVGEAARRLWPALAVFLAISAFMYVSIMYKIVNYGP